MALFAFIREAFERERAAPSAPAPVIVPIAPPPHDPVLRMMACVFVCGIVSTNDVSFEDAWVRLYSQPIHSLALLDSPAGWIALAAQMGFSPRVTVH